MTCSPIPELYIEQDPIPTAMAIGMGKPIIVVSTGMLDLVDDEGLRFIIGHEVGHVLSGHAVYRTMLISLVNLAAAMEWLPIGAWGIRAIILGLNEWFRKSELSCDRAGLLCSQDPGAALRAHASMAGARNPNEMDIAAFLDQAEEYEKSGDVRDSLLKILQMSGKSHPLAALRAAELQKWAAGPEIRRDPGGKLPATVRRQNRADERGGQGCRQLVQAQLHDLRRPAGTSWWARSVPRPGPSAASQPIGCVTGGEAADRTRTRDIAGWRPRQAIRLIRSQRPRRAKRHWRSSSSGIHRRGRAQRSGTPAARRRSRPRHEEAGIALYVHAPYVLNVATTNNRIRIPSRKFLQQYLDAAAEVGATGLIVHGGHVLKNDDPAIGFDNWRKCIDGWRCAYRY